MGVVDKVRHALERGKILKTLQEEYSGRLTRVAHLQGALDLLGYPISMESLQFSLTYLYDEGYVSIVRAYEAPGWRADREIGSDPQTIVFAKLLPKGIRLIDGDEAANAGVRF